MRRLHVLFDLADYALDHEVDKLVLSVNGAMRQIDVMPTATFAGFTIETTP